jgi:hypothetical protein
LGFKGAVVGMSSSQPFWDLGILTPNDQSAYEYISFVLPGVLSLCQNSLYPNRLKMTTYAELATLKVG